MYLFVFNPVAGRGRSKKILEEVKQVFGERGASYEVWETTGPNTAPDLARRAAEQGYESIISVGGDGTVLEVASGLLGTGCKMGVIPAGTGNDFIKSLGMDNDHIAAANAILDGHTRKVDIGSTEEGNCFMNVAGTGFDTEVVRYTERFKATLQGVAAYLMGVLCALFNYKCQRMRLTMDGNVIEDSIFLVAIANGKAYGGGMMVAPKASLFDGMFDVTVIYHLPKLKVPVIIGRFMSGKHEGLKDIKSYRCSEIRLELLDNVMPINMDGELIGQTPMTFKVLEKALAVFVPETGENNE